MSAAKPKIADYPFTTLEPHLGVVRFRDHEFVLADIPGLIEGAAEGRGLGHTFLRHVERARVLVLLLDLASVEERSPEEQERVLLDELERYRPELLERPRLVVGSKADVATSELHDPDAITLSAVTRAGLDEFLGRLGNLVDEARARGARRRRAVRHAAPGRGGVHRRPRRRRRVARHRAHRRARRRDGRPHERGSDRVRAGPRCAGWASSARSPRAGAREGDVVRVGPVELEYQEGFT